MDERSPAEVAHVTPVITLSDTEPRIDMARLRDYRLGRVRAMLARFEYGGCLLFDPINIRYATGVRSHSVFSSHIPGRYVYIPAEGPVVLFEDLRDNPAGSTWGPIEEVRPQRIINFFFGGTRAAENAKLLGEEVADLVARHGAGDKRLAVDRANAMAYRALLDQGLDITDGQELMERARAVKSAEEILCMNYSIAVAETGMARMREALVPGMTENELWAILHETNIAMGGEWIDARLMAAGDRANPWSQEASDRVIRPAELVAFDTDMIGPFGYCADISRTIYAGPGRPSADQRALYRQAYDEVHYNIEIPKPGMSFREYAERAFKTPEDCIPNRYIVLSHGIGMCDEYPAIYSLHDWDRKGFDDTFEENMTLCVESYVGPVGGHEGVKLERQCLLTAAGLVPLDKFPFEDELLA